MSQTVTIRRPAPVRRAPAAPRRDGAGSARREPPARSLLGSGPATHLEHRVIIGAVFGLCLLGLPVVLSASAVPSLEAGTSVYSLFVKQALFLAIGTAVAAGAARLTPEVLRRFRFALPMVALGLLVIVFLPGIGHDAGGSSRWIGFGPIQLQPSELMKLAVVVYAADLLARRAKREDHWHAVVVPLLALLGVAGILIMKQPDLGTCIVICCITFALMFAAGLPVRTVAGAALLVGVPGAVLALDASYRRARLLSFLHPFATASGTGYQVVQSLVTLGQGGVRGNGIGGSPTTWGYLPNGHTDFIYAVIGGNLGIVGSIGVVAGFGVLAWAGFRVAAREPDAFTRYVAVGLTCWLLAQAVINIGGVVDALPVTGIPLPFISYGGSALVMAMAAAGLLAGIARRQVAAEPVPVRAPSARAAAREGRRAGATRASRPAPARRATR